MVAEKTCAACDCKLDSNPIAVRIGGRTVEVCCEECAVKLKEAHASAAAQASKGTRTSTLALIGACLIAGFGSVSFEAHASESDRGTKAIEVRYGDLDMRSAEGVETLYQRLTRAANRACSQSSSRLSVATTRRHVTCVRTSLTAAVSKIDHPALTARFNGTPALADGSRAVNAPAAACTACRAR